MPESEAASPVSYVPSMVPDVPAQPHKTRDESWMFGPWKLTDEPAIKKVVEELVERAKRDGVSPDEVLRRISEGLETGIDTVIEESGRSLARRLRNTEANMVAGRERLRRGFERRLNQG